MESFVGQMQRSSTNLYSDTTHRLTARPAPVQAGKGRAYEAMKSDFSPPRKSKPPPTSQPSQNANDHLLTYKGPRRGDVRGDPESSEDELLLSQDSIRGEGRKKLSHTTSMRIRDNEERGRKRKEKAEKEKDPGRAALKGIMPNPTTQNFRGFKITKNSTAASSSKPEGAHRSVEPPPSSSLATIDVDPDDDTSHTTRLGKSQSRTGARSDMTPTRTLAGSSRAQGNNAHIANQTREARLKKRVMVEKTRRCVDTDDEDEDADLFEHPPAARTRDADKDVSTSKPKPKPKPRKPQVMSDDDSPPRPKPTAKPRPKPRQKIKSAATDEDERAQSDPEGTPRASRLRKQHGSTTADDLFGPDSPTSPSTPKRRIRAFPMGLPEPAKENTGVPPPRQAGGKGK
ncbi:hypothetical protein CONPUDRAFT_138229, partial [Coniophora puteana RWD-64-598 SS2]